MPKIDPLVFTAKFPHRCDLAACGSKCCAHGVWTDREESREILAHQELFKPWVRPEAADPVCWFGVSEPDEDCPSGVAVETQAIGGACALFHPDHGCAIQKGAIEAGYDGWRFKPRFCIMFPLVVTGGLLTVDEDMKMLWCMQPENRTRPILSAVEAEVRKLFEPHVVEKLLGKVGGPRLLG